MRAGGPGSARSAGTFVSKIEEKVLLLLRGKMRKARERERVEVDGVKKVSQHRVRTSDCWEKDYQVLTKQSVH